MTRAVFDGVVVAESDDVRVVEGITYFPRSSVVDGVLGATYFHVDNGDDTALDSAFVYENPWPLARRLVADRVGFWRDVTIEN